MKYTLVALLTFVPGLLAGGTLRPTFEPVKGDSEALARRQSCESGYGYCSNTGVCCPLGGDCCSDGTCCNAGYQCWISANGVLGCCPNGQICTP